MPRPTLPMDILTAIGGMGRGLVERLPDDVKFPPIAPLEPFYGAGKAPQPSVRDIGEFLVPQSALDVGLMAVPGGKVGKKAGGKLVDEAVGALEDARRGFLRKKPAKTFLEENAEMINGYTEAKLVPAIRRGKEEYVGKLGKDIFHSQLYKRYKLSDKYYDEFEQGFVDSTTGEWLDMGLAAERAAKGEAQRATKLGITSMPKEADLLAAKSGLTEFSDNIVPSIRDPHSGKEYLGRLGKEVFHTDVLKHHGLDKWRSPSSGKVYENTVERFDRGFVDSTTGKWLEPREATKLSQERAKQFLVKEKKEP